MDKMIKGNPWQRSPIPAQPARAGDVNTGPRRGAPINHGRPASLCRYEIELSDGRMLDVTNLSDEQRRQVEREHGLLDEESVVINGRPYSEASINELNMAVKSLREVMKG